MNIEEQFATLKAEVDALQIQAAEKRRPWYATPSVLLSIFALLFSFGTTLFSYMKSYDDDVRNNRKEVRELIQRITRLPIENFEISEKYSGNPAGESLSAMINQELMVLSTQAAERIKRFPDSFTSTEYFAVAGALANSGNFHDVPTLLTKAIELATTANDYSVACRSYGHFLMTQSKIDEGRAYYAKALTEVWAKFPTSDPFVRSGLTLQGKLNQVSSELMIGDISAARQALAEAEGIVGKFPESPAKGYWTRQFQAMAMAVDSAAQPPWPSVPLR
jgi:hypothetical protein